MMQPIIDDRLLPFRPGQQRQADTGANSLAGKFVFRTVEEPEDLCNSVRIGLDDGLPRAP